MSLKRVFGALFVVALLAAACGADDDDDQGADPPATEVVTEAPVDEVEVVMGPPFVDTGRTLDAPQAVIVVDGDAADWADVDGLDMTLFPITDEGFDTKEATLKVAHDDEFVYVLFQVDDDYNWNAEDPHLSGSSAIQWAIDPGAGEGMGATDADRETSLGLVDIWHWELECAAGEQSGGAVSGPGEGKDPGNDAACNFDDEYASHTEAREDDNSEGAENSLLGVWTHTADVAEQDGTWTFEMRRPLNTGDVQDIQFEAGSNARVAVAYWDADTGPEGWEDEFHVMSANQGWITINLL